MTTNDDDFHQLEGTEGTFWEQADDTIRENPIPSILTALVIGFGLGLLVRALEPERKSDTWRDYMDDTQDAVGSFFAPLAKKSRHAGHAVRDAVGHAVERVQDRVHDIDVDPVAKWWHRLWS